MVLSDGLLSDVNTLVKNEVLASFTHIGFGTGTSTPTAAQTELDAEVIRVTRSEYSSTTNTVTNSGYLSSSQGNGSTFKEIAFFDAVSSGQMEQRNVLGVPVLKTSDKELWIDSTIKTTITNT
jgi:hypothetical protein